MQKNTKKVQSNMNKLLKNTISYITYLKNDCNLNVSVHFSLSTINGMPKNIFMNLLPYNCHTNAYCIMAKNINHTKCLEHQKNILQKLQNKDYFCDVCHAQVYEYLYPIRNESTVIGYVAVSGYKPSDAIESNIINHELWNSVLDDHIPLELCNCVIPPLIIMLELILNISSKESDNEYSLLLQFLNEYHTHITLANLAKHFNRSKSHISHLFKKESGLTIRAYCNNLKLYDAKNLILNTDMSITQIAYESGFSNTSYFIELFKNKFGSTPLQYKQTHR